MENTDTIQSLYDQSGLLDILIGVEEYMDNMDLYAYKNWIKGELVEGPIVSKYWVEVTFKYNALNFPDPRAALMFEKQGTKIFIKKDYEVKPIENPRSEEDMMSVLGQGSSVKKVKDERIPILLIKFQIPRRLVNPESFDEYKMMITAKDDIDDQEPMGIESEDDNIDIEFDELEQGVQ